MDRIIKARTDLPSKHYPFKLIVYTTKRNYILWFESLEKATVKWKELMDYII